MSGFSSLVHTQLVSLTSACISFSSFQQSGSCCKIQLGNVLQGRPRGVAAPNNLCHILRFVCGKTETLLQIFPAELRSIFFMLVSALRVAGWSMVFATPNQVLHSGNKSCIFTLLPLYLSASHSADNTWHFAWHSFWGDYSRVYNYLNNVLENSLMEALNIVEDNRILKNCQKVLV